MNQNEVVRIVSDNKKLLVATVDYKDQVPVAIVKQGKEFDSITLDSIASQLYGRKVHCVVEPLNE